MQLPMIKFEILPVSGIWTSICDIL